MFLNQTSAFILMRNICIFDLRDSDKPAWSCGCSVPIFLYVVLWKMRWFHVGVLIFFHHQTGRKNFKDCGKKSLSFQTQEEILSNLADEHLETEFHLSTSRFAGRVWDGCGCGLFIGWQLECNLVQRWGKWVGIFFQMVGNRWEESHGRLYLSLNDRCLWSQVATTCDVQATLAESDPIWLWMDSWPLRHARSCNKAKTVHIRSLVAFGGEWIIYWDRKSVV